MPLIHEIATHIRRDQAVQRTACLAKLPHDEEMDGVAPGKLKPQGARIVSDDPPGRFWSRLLNFRRDV